MYDLSVSKRGSVALRIAICVCIALSTLIAVSVSCIDKSVRVATLKFSPISNDVGHRLIIASSVSSSLALAASSNTWQSSSFFPSKINPPSLISSYQLGLVTAFVLPSLRADMQAFS